MVNDNEGNVLTQEDSNILHASSHLRRIEEVEVPSNVPSDVPSKEPNQSPAEKSSEGAEILQLSTKDLGTKDYEFFIRRCKSYLFFNPPIDDGKISQVDFTNFLIDICLFTGKCPSDETQIFGNLPVPLQLRFLWVECPPLNDTKAADEGCLNEFTKFDANGEFGVTVTEENRDDVEIKVDDLCKSIYPHAETYYGGTGGIMSTVPSFSPSQSTSTTLAPSPIPLVEAQNDRSIRSIDRTTGIATTVSVAAIILFFCFYIGCRSRSEEREKDDAAINNDLSNDDGRASRIEDQDTNNGAEIMSESRAMPKMQAISTTSDEEEQNYSDDKQEDKDEPIITEPDEVPKIQTITTSDEERSNSNSATEFDSELSESDTNTHSSLAQSVPRSNGKDGFDASDSDNHTDDDNIDLMLVKTSKESKSLMQHLDAAIDDGDWDTVAVIAGDMGDNDYSPGSSASGSSGNTSASSSISGKSLSEVEKVEMVNKLVADKNWKAVDTLTNASEADYESEAEKTESTDNKSSITPNKRRNLIDFITKSWTNSRVEENASDKDNSEKEVDIESLDSGRLSKIRKEIEELVRRIIPDEINNVDEMMNQFQGREEELLETLRTMVERRVK